jgi:hypothetical protein
LFKEKRTEFSLRAPVIDFTGASMPLCTIGAAIGAGAIATGAAIGAGAGAESLTGEDSPSAARSGACMPSETMVAAPAAAVRTGASACSPENRSAPGAAPPAVAPPRPAESVRRVS